MPEENNLVKAQSIKARIAALEQLKTEYLNLTSQGNVDNNVIDVDNPASKANASTHDKVITLSTPIGRAMKENSERGSSSALMLGLISFALEIGFIIMTFLMYR